MTFILIILVTRMKRDYQDDSSFSSWYPIKPGERQISLENFRKALDEP